MLPLSVPRAAVLPAASRTTVTRVRLAGKLQERGGESKASHLPAGEGRAGWTRSMCIHRACSQHRLTPWKGCAVSLAYSIIPSMPAKKGRKISSPGLKGLRQSQSTTLARVPNTSLPDTSDFRGPESDQDRPGTNLWAKTTLFQLFPAYPRARASLYLGSLDSCAQPGIRLAPHQAYPGESSQQSTMARPIPTQEASRRSNVGAHSSNPTLGRLWLENH